MHAQVNKHILLGAGCSIDIQKGGGKDDETPGKRKTRKGECAQVFTHFTLHNTTPDVVNDFSMTKVFAKDTHLHHQEHFQHGSRE
jgi:hypothetical protein